MHHPSHASLPEHIGPYRIVGELGRGGMGVVYTAEDPRLRRRVALKVLPEHLAGDAVRLARFEREAQLLAAMNHPNIATIHSLEADGGVRFLTMELVEGETLDLRLEGGPLPADELLSVGRQIAHALEAAHRKGVVHRDLKPSNVKITVDGSVKVLDFGIAKAVSGDVARERAMHPRGELPAGLRPGGERLLGPMMRPEAADEADADADAETIAGDGATLAAGSDEDADATLAAGAGDADADDATLAVGSDDDDATLASDDTPPPGADSSIGSTLGTTLPGKLIGTPGYMAPEQLRGEEVDHRADVWAFGCVLYQCATARRLFPGKTLRAAIRETLKEDISLDGLPPGTPEAVRSLIERCLVRDPEARLSSMAAARQELEREIAQRAMPSAVAGDRRRGASGPNNLPTQLSTFVGRTRPLEKVQGLLREERVVTLTGAGGCGKTRLAIEAGWNALPRFADGVWLVELAPLEDQELVAATVISALGVQETPGKTAMETLTEHLAEKTALLVLDNCERVLEMCAALTAAVVGSCPGVRVLATSRQAMSADGEAVYHVPLLDVPDERTPADALPGFESVRLFVERARGARADFELTKETGPPVAQIVRRLDGIPLAIELAAARVKVMPPAEIAKRLDDRFRLLRTRDAQPLAHHQTLQALIEWSWEHLEIADQALFRRLAAFSGGWTLESAEKVCVGGDVEEWDVLDILQELVDRSLVESDAERSQGTDHARFRMLETVREYARARLEDSGEHPDIRMRHRQHFLELAEEAEPNLTGAEQVEWLFRLSAEHDNLRSALGAPGEGVGEKALRLGGALGRYWSVRGHWNEGRRVLADLFDRAKNAPKSTAMGKALHWAGNLAYRQGDYAEARAKHEKALEVRRAIGDRAGVAASLDSLGAVAHDQGDLNGSLAFFDEALSIRRSMGDQWAIAQSVNNLGVAIEATGDYKRAAELHREALRIRRQLGDKWGVAGSLNNLGCALECLEDYVQAVALHDESLEIRRGLGDKWGIGLSLKNLGFATYRLGDLKTARELFKESVEVFREIDERFEMAHSLAGMSRVARRSGDAEEALKLARECLEIRAQLGEPRGIANSLEGFAGLAVDAGDWVRAARLFGAAEALRESVGAPVPAPERAGRERDLGALKAALGDGLAAEWEAGRALEVERAVLVGMGHQAIV